MGLRASLDVLENKKKSFASPAIQSQDRPVCSLVTVPNALACSETIKYYEKFRNTLF